MDEYEQIQRLRELWSRMIATWGQVFIPLGAAIIAFFVTQARSNAGNWDFGFLFIGWLLFATSMVYWRWIVHHIDDQIVGLYPSMLRLDKRSEWETQTRYYYNNLSKHSEKFLKEYIQKDASENIRKKKADYEAFKDTAKSKDKDHYDLLLEVWRKYQRNSVGDRGHKIQDKIIFLVMVCFLVIVLSVNFCAWALLALFLYPVIVIPWGRRYGWWFVKLDP